MYSMNRIYILYALIFLSLSVNSEETFALSKKSLHTKTSGHLKEELGVLLEELAHAITRHIQELAQAQQELLYRIRELVDGSATGAFSGAPHKVLQQRVHEARALVEQMHKDRAHIGKLVNFLKGS